MRVFMLARDPRTCARLHNDKHVIGMPKIYATLLCNTYHYIFNKSIREAGQDQDKIDNLLIHKSGIPYRENQMDHELSVWTRASVRHFLWLQVTAKALTDEYRHRFENVQKVETVLDYTFTHAKDIMSQFSTTAQFAPVPTKIKGIARPNLQEVIQEHRRTYEDGIYTKRDKPNFLNSKILQ